MSIRHQRAMFVTSPFHYLLKNSEDVIKRHCVLFILRAAAVHPLHFSLQVEKHEFRLTSESLHSNPG